MLDGVVAFDRTGEAIYTLITPPNMPQLPFENVIRIQQYLFNATYEYYRRNTLPGCMDPQAANFNWLVGSA